MDSVRTVQKCVHIEPTIVVFPDAREVDNLLDAVAFQGVLSAYPRAFQDRGRAKRTSRQDDQLRRACSARQLVGAEEYLGVLDIFHSRGFAIPEHSWLIRKN